MDVVADDSAAGGIVHGGVGRAAAPPPFTALFSSDHVVIGSGSYGGVARIEVLPGLGEAHVRRVLASYGDAAAAAAPRLPRLVVKVLKLASSAHNAEQAARERDALATWRHRNIVRFFGAWEVGDATLIVLEAAEGVGDGPLLTEPDLAGASDGDFWRFIVTRPRLPEAQVRFIAFQVLSAVRFLHSRGVIHRDLKPENMLCFGPAVATSAGAVPVVKISDFGTARAVPTEVAIGLVRRAPLAHSMTVVADDHGRGKYVGSREFMAPEVWAGIEQSGGVAVAGSGAGAGANARKTATYSLTADIYSLGVSLFFIATRQQIHNGACEAEVKRRCLAGELSTGHLFDAKFSEDGRDLLGRMLALDPRERATAEEAIAHRWFTPAFLAEARRLFGDERGRE